MTTETKLTLTERNVLKMLAKGVWQKEIAEKLCLSNYEVRKNINNAAEKLHARNTIHAVFLAVKHGFIDI